MTTSTTIRARFGYDDLPALLARQAGDEKHDRAATSTLDVLWVLYDQVLDVGPDRLDDPTRDRFLLSKGHGPQSYYAVLAAKGYFDVSWLDGFGAYDSPLGHHPDRTMIPGVEISSGSLGHGLPIAVGLAVGLRAAGLDARVVTLIGDAELDEGSNAEAIEFAARPSPPGRRPLAPFTVVAIDNRSATHGWGRGLERRFATAGWDVACVDGRDHAALAGALARPRDDRPNLVVATLEAKA